MLLILIVLSLVAGVNAQTYRSPGLYDGGGSVRWIPRVLSYQGYLADSTGQAIDDSLDMIFAIYSDVTGGLELWTESLEVGIHQGSFDILLGTANPIPDSVFRSEDPRWLQVSVEGEDLAPRTRLSSVPYAYSASWSDSALRALDANNADSAGFAVSSEASAYADTATFSHTSDTASFAMTSEHAMNSDSAIYADSAAHSIHADTAQWAMGVGDIAYADTAGFSFHAAVADSAVLSAQANSALTALEADHAVSADTAIWALDAGHADTADFALSASVTDDGDWTVAGNDMYTSVSGNVGIGTAAPMYALHVLGTVVSGESTEASGSYSTVGGGRADTAKALYGAVMSGYSNLAGNSIGDTAAFVGGGFDNQAVEEFAALVGGVGNEANGPSSFVGGGAFNQAIGVYSAVSGGAENEAAGDASVVCGGQTNRSKNTFGFIGGGQGNTVTGEHGAVGGGYDNTASGTKSTILGGASNLANGTGSVICGGIDNTVGNGDTDSCTSVVGGSKNQALGAYSVVLGGKYDTLTSYAHHSMAFGELVFIDDDHSVVLFDGSHSGHLQLNRDHRDATPSTAPIQVGTDATNGNGAYLSSGGVWTDALSQSNTEDSRAIDRIDLIEKVKSLEVTNWRFEGSPERHISPLAEEFGRTFGVGAVRADGTLDDGCLSAMDVAGVSLASVQELIRIVDLQGREIEELKAELLGR
jgi:hypothetical protein